MVKRLILFFLIMLLLISAVTADISSTAGNFAKQGIQKVVCKAAGPVCQAYSWINNPIGVLPPDARKIISGAQNPLGAGEQQALSQIYSNLPKDAKQAADIMQKAESYLKQIGVKEPEKSGFTTEYTDDGTLIIKENKNIYASIPKGYCLHQDQTGGFVLTNEGGTNKELQLGIYKLSNINKNAKIVFNENRQTGDIFIGVDGTGDISFGNQKYSQLQNAKFVINKTTNEVSMADFTSKNGGKYDFQYNKISYNFNVQSGGNILFDPKNKQIQAKNTDLKLGNKDINGNFKINLGDLGAIKNIEFDSNGKFIDTSGNIIATSTEGFTVCLSTHDASNTDLNKLKDGCQGKNSFWLNTNENLNLIKTEGKIKYNIGKYTEIDTISTGGAATTYGQTPNMDDFFQVTSGKALLEKDQIRSWVEYKSCNKITGGITGFAVPLLNIKQNCGLFVSTDRTGIPSVITQRINIIDPDGKYKVQIGSTGMLSATNIKNPGISVDGAYKKFKNSNEDVFFSNIQSLYGKPITSKETTSTIFIDKYISDLERQKNDLEFRCEKIETKCFEVLQGLNFVGSPNRRLKALDEVNGYITQLGNVRNQLKSGANVEDALKNAGIPATFKSSIINGISDDGSLNPQELFTNSIKRNNECFSANEYSMALCVEESKIMFDLGKNVLDKKYNVYQDSNGEDTLLSKFITERKASGFIDKSKDESVSEGIAYMKKMVAYYNKNGITYISDSKDTTKKLYTVNDLSKELDRLQSAYNDGKFQNLDKANNQLNSFSNKVKLSLPFITEAGTYDALILTAGDVAGFAKAYRLRQAVNVGEYKLAREAISNLDETAREGVSLFKTLSKTDKAAIHQIKNLEDIPNIARVCI